MTRLALRDHNARILLMSKTLDQLKGKLREMRSHIERLAERPPRTTPPGINTLITNRFLLNWLAYTTDDSTVANDTANE